MRGGGAWATSLAPVRRAPPWPWNACHRAACTHSCSAVMEGARVLLNASRSEAEELLEQLPPPRPGGGPASLQDSAAEHPFGRDDLYSPHDPLMETEDRSPKSYLSAHAPGLDLPGPRKAAGLWAPASRGAAGGGAGGGVAGFRAASQAATDRSTSAGWVLQVGMCVSWPAEASRHQHM